MKPLKLALKKMCMPLLTLVASMNIHSQEIPYTVNDKKRLDLLFQDAKAKLEVNENDLGWLKSAGIASHQLARLKVKGASEDAVNYLKKAIALDSSDVVILAHLGSAYAMAGRDSSFVVSKVSNVNKGLAALDKAVKQAPKNLHVRLLRAGVTFDLPAMFSRKSTAESDYLMFVNEANAGKEVDMDRLAEAYFKLGEIAKEKGQTIQAKNFYMEAEKSAPESNWAQQAKKAL